MTTRRKPRKYQELEQWELSHCIDVSDPRLCVGMCGFDGNGFRGYYPEYFATLKKPRRPKCRICSGHPDAALYALALLP
jgi:hypothetical protein